MPSFEKGNELFDKLDKWFHDFIENGETHVLVYKGVPLALHTAYGGYSIYRQPTTIKGIQSLAGELRDVFRIKYTMGLHLASRRAGFDDFPDAKRKLLSRD